MAAQSSLGADFLGEEWACSQDIAEGHFCSFRDADAGSRLDASCGVSVIADPEAAHWRSEVSPVVTSPRNVECLA